MGSKMVGFFVGFLSAAIISSTPSFGALSESDRASIPVRNLLTNPGAENGLAGVTVSGGTLTRTTEAISSGSVGSGNAAFAWDSNAAGQTFTFATVPIPAGLYGHNIQLSCNIKGNGATHIISIWDGLVESQPVSIKNLPNYARSSIDSVASSSGSISLRLTSVSANEPPIMIDDCNIGEASNTSQISQASLVGTIKVSGCAADWTTTSATFANFAAQTGCTYTTEGLAQQPSTNIPAIKFGLLPEGEYSIVVSGSLYGGTASTFTAWQMHDGTNASRDAVAGTSDATVYPTAGGVGAFSFKYDTAQTNITLQIQGKVSGGGYIYVGQTTMPMTIKVYRYPTYSQLAYTFDTTASSWSGYHASDCNWSRTNTAYGDPASDASCTFTERKNTNFGTVTSYTSGDKLPGITFTPKAAQKYMVCYATRLGAGAGAGATASLELSDLDSVVSFENQNQASGTQSEALSGCGIYEATSVVPKTLRLRFKSSAGSASIQTYESVPAIEWSIVAINQSFPAPLVAPEARSEVRMDTYTVGSQFATTNTNVFRYSNTYVNNGTAFTTASDAALGHSITLNEDGLYCANATFFDDGTGTSTMEITKNSTALTAGSGVSLCSSAGQPGINRNRLSCSACFIGIIGDVIRETGAGVVDQPSTAGGAGSYIRVLKMSR